MADTLRIDVHAHLLTQHYLSAMEAAGVVSVDGFPTPRWSVASAIEVMDRNAITTALLSTSSPGIRFAEGAAARALARNINEEMAAIVSGQPTRFGAFALLPLPDVEGSLLEIVYALDVLKLDGIGLYTNIDGAYLGDALYEPVFQELDRRNAVVFVHPVQPPSFEKLSMGFPAPMLEYPFDTTRMVSNLIGSGMRGRYPNVRMILPHGGGVIPYLVPRMAVLISTFKQGLSMPDVIAQLKSFYYDVTAASHPLALAPLTSFVPKSQLLYGSDMPFMPEFSIPPALETLSTYPGLSADDRVALDSGNALGLFPRLKALFAGA